MTFRPRLRAAALGAAALLAAPAARVAAQALAAPAVAPGTSLGTASGSAVGTPPAAVGTLVVAHGGDSVWNAHVLDVARRANTGGPVEVSFLMGPGARAARFQDAVARLAERGAREAVVVPMLVSSHSGHYDQIRWLAGEPVALDEAMHHHLHMAGIARPDPALAARVPLRLAPAMDDAVQVAEVLADRALALAAARGAQPARRALFIVGHGPNSAEDHAAWMENLRRVADTVRARTGFGDVRVDLVRDDAPAPVRAEAVRRVRELIELQHAATGDTVLVVPVLVSKGSVSRDKVPADIRGTPSVYVGEPLLPHPAMARWVEARVAEARRVARQEPRQATR